MKLGFVSAILPDLSFEEVVKFAAETGYECIEVMCWPKGKAERRYAGVTHIDVATLTKDEAAKINELLAKYNVSISGLGYYPNPLAPDEAEAQVYIEHIKKVISAAPLLGLKVVNTFIGRDWTKTIDDNWPRFKKVWPDLVKFAEDKGVKIGIENCPMFFTNDEWPGGKNLAHSPKVWRRMFEEIPSDHFGLNFDPSHLVWQGIDVYRAVKEFGKKFVHVHAKDARLDVDKLYDCGFLANPLEYHTPKLPGLGDVNWGKFFSALTDVGYDGPVCVEVEDRAYEGSLERRKASLKQSYAFLRKFIA
ncbi:MAG: sugar phosphate isomerase/epimerase [candidate division KSB1 bacterium]|nr:sugar phosphate isomerase/epimerase [candidate division KSB1 bacterium]MDZ7345625.1 sugar phosphate isomerase/epimerase [candidate division KSB1 bacterium]MDZ7371213.1 sugar phosphate isomerase/epimerase [candidate division KSB1 bacterium]